MSALGRLRAAVAAMFPPYERTWPPLDSPLPGGISPLRAAIQARCEAFALHSRRAEVRVVAVFASIEAGEPEAFVRIEVVDNGRRTREVYRVTERDQIRAERVAA